MLAVALAAGVLCACGVKGPLYFPEDRQREDEKDEEKKSSSRAGDRRAG